MEAQEAYAIKKIFREVVQGFNEELLYVEPWYDEYKPRDSSALARARCPHAAPRIKQGSVAEYDSGTQEDTTRLNRVEEEVLPLNPIQVHG